MSQDLRSFRPDTPCIDAMLDLPPAPARERTGRPLSEIRAEARAEWLVERAHQDLMTIVAAIVRGGASHLHSDADVVARARQILDAVTRAELAAARAALATGAPEAPRDHQGAIDLDSLAAGAYAAWHTRYVGDPVDWKSLGKRDPNAMAAWLAAVADVVGKVVRGEAARVGDGREDREPIAGYEAFLA